ncbi:MAG: DedA family protein [Candidatus Adlerbacteria bacterium]|nr:DedA family protein [Candidatus Adlerbacteria bacterium]MDZ4226441.1 DedA family protein [Patescibacteria group bacterium]
MPLGTIGALILQYKYLVMVPLIPFAQPFVGMIAGFLSRLGVMELWVVYVVLVSVTLAYDVVWYLIGYRWGERFAVRFGRFVSITPTHIEHTKRIFHRYHAPILLVSKITNGLGLAIVTLFTAGLTKIPFGRYLVLNLIGELIWSAIVISIGYFFGDAYDRIHDIFGRATIIVFFSLFILVTIGFSVYIRRRLERAAL